MEKRNRIIYWVSTGLLCALMLMSAGMYLVNYDEVAGVFNELGYPTYIVYPLAILKILGVVAILSDKSKFLKEWAYAGFFYDFVLAFAAHWYANDGGHWTALIAIAVLVVSYVYNGKRT